ncbi:TPA: hypothetical protein HA274_02130 [Candidatus Bathyarchaeota archaeon]|nr:hypothetical protein [Candidatus Bathyarchaeota archaeon]
MFCLWGSPFRQGFLAHTVNDQEGCEAFKIIPVLDILDGIAVHAVRGQRREYKPLKSILSASSCPADIALAFEELGFTEMYVADLDAITGSRNQSLLSLRQISDESKIRLTVDAGISDLELARKLLQIDASKIVIGTETLSSIGFVQEALQSFGKERVVVSLDLMDGAMVGNLGSLGSFKIMDLLKIFAEMDLRQVIVLDLGRVGSGEGVNKDFLKNVLRCFDFDVFVGGGVRDLNDLLELEKLGLRGVLLATALHSGAVRVEDLVEEGMEI